MININKFNSYEDYLKSVLLSGESSVSLVGNIVKYDPKNLILHRGQPLDNEVCLVFKDTYDSNLVFVPFHTYDSSTFDSQRYEKKDWVRFTRSEGHEVLIHKTAVGSAQWATSNKYRLHCDLTASGGFGYAVTINDSVKTGTVTWEAGETLAQVAAKITGTNSYFTVTTVAGEEFIRISCSSYNNTTFTLSNVTGATIDDLSLYCRIGGVQQAESHRSWQAQDVNTLFPNQGFLPANTVQYAQNGIDLSYRCICNLPRAKEYYRISGTGHGGVDTYLAESSKTARMSKIGFASCNGSGVAEQQALFDKYHGSWDAYMEASKIQINDKHTNGVEYKSYSNGDTQSDFLCSVTTMTFDGSYIPVYTSASMTRALADVDFGGGNMPTNHEIAVFMDATVMAQINAAFTTIGGANLLSNSAYYWSVAQYDSSNAWVFSGTTGCLNNIGKIGAYGCRSLAYV